MDSSWAVQMDRQNIARVLDAGTTDSGRPNFLMELVSRLPARSGGIAGKTQAAEQQVNKRRRPEERCTPVRVGSVSIGCNFGRLHSTRCARSWQASSHPQTLNTGLTFLDQAPSIGVC